MTNHLAVILDMSGSMSPYTQQTRDSTEEYIKGVRREFPDTELTFTVFDNLYERWIDGVKLGDVRIGNVLKRYVPRNSTALYDAVGKTLNDLKRRVKKKDRATVVIITDGYENASVEYTSSQVQAEITRLQRKNNWTFVYLSANADAWAGARAIGIPHGNAAQWTYGKGQFKASDGLLRSTIGRFNAPTTSSVSLFADAGETQDYTEDGNYKSPIVDNKNGTFDVDQLQTVTPRPKAKRRGTHYVSGSSR